MKQIIVAITVSLLLNQYSLCFQKDDLLYATAARVIIENSSFLKKTCDGLGTFWQEIKESDNQNDYSTEFMEPFYHLANINEINKDTIIQLAEVINNNSTLQSMTFDNMYKLSVCTKLFQVSESIQRLVLNNLLTKYPSNFTSCRDLSDDYAYLIQCCDINFLRHLPFNILAKKNLKNKEIIEDNNNVMKEDLQQIETQNYPERVLQSKTKSIKKYFEELSKNTQRFIYPINNSAPHNKDLFKKYILGCKLNINTIIVVGSNLESVYGLEQYCDYFDLCPEHIERLLLHTNNIHQPIDISYLCSQFKNVSHIDLSNNNIQDIFVGNYQIHNVLRSLILANNNIKGTLDLSKLLVCSPNIRMIDLRHNEIDTIVFPENYHNPSLKIYASSTTINTLPDSTLKFKITQQNYTKQDFYYEPIQK